MGEELHTQKKLFSKKMEKSEKKVKSLTAELEQVKMEISSLESRLWEALNPSLASDSDGRRRLIAAPPVPPTPCLESTSAFSLSSIAASLGTFLIGGLLLRHCLRKRRHAQEPAELAIYRL